MENIKNLESYLEMTADLIKYHTDKNRNILIHCDDSIDISPSILVAYIIKYYNKNLYEACSYIMNKHFLAFIIKTKFKISLINYEYNILKKNSKDISFIHFKKFNYFWLILLSLLIFIIILIISINNKILYIETTNTIKKREYLTIAPKKLIYDLN